MIRNTSFSMRDIACNPEPARWCHHLARKIFMAAIFSRLNFWPRISSGPIPHQRGYSQANFTETVITRLAISQKEIAVRFCSVQARKGSRDGKWCPDWTSNDPRTVNDPQIVSQIPRNGNDILATIRGNEWTLTLTLDVFFSLKISNCKFKCNSYYW